VKTNLKWGPILELAVEIVDSYDTLVTLRQLFYRLVAAMLIPNLRSMYTTLSSKTAKARRDGSFPALSDTGRSIYQYESWDSPAAAQRYAARSYRRHRTDGQPVALYLAVEKQTLVAQMMSWFGDPLGIPVLALRGYSSESYEREIAANVDTYANGRPVVVLYAGDFDPSGEDLVRNFKKQLTARGIADWTLEQVALTDEQVAEYGLPEAQGKESDPRAAAFAERHGKLVQVEVEALDPELLRELFQKAIDKHWDQQAYKEVMSEEYAERADMLARCEEMD
jgi:hypothetical protein